MPDNCMIGPQDRTENVKKILRTILVAAVMTALLHTPGSALPHRTKRGNTHDVQDPFRAARMMTSRAVITVEGRGSNRQLTTYNAIDDNPSSHLEFGFPPPHRRQFATEKMEIFDAPTPPSGQQDGVRKITLRHPWHDVYLTSDRHHNVRACVYDARRRPNGGSSGFVCQDPPYIYLEDWNLNRGSPGSSLQNNHDSRCYKVRFHANTNPDTRGDSSMSQISYLHVTEATWQMRLRTQISLLTHALSIATKRAWEESLNVLFLDQIDRFQDRSRTHRNTRRRRCAANPVSVRDHLISQMNLQSVRREIRRSLRTNRDCSDLASANYQSYDNSFQLASKVPWKTMTPDAKVSLMCHVGHVVRTRLRDALLGLADTRCIRRRKWGRLTEERRRALLDKYLTVAWLRRRTEADEWLLGIVRRQLDARTTSLCLHGDS